MSDRDRLPEDLISGYLDGELTAEQRAAVEQQLARSTGWAAVLIEITDVRARVRALPVPEAPPGFWDAALEGRDPVRRARRRIEGPLGWVAGGAAAAVVVVAFVVPSPHHASPSVATLVDSHAARSSLSQDPITQLAPIGFPR
jgi:anti-sigma factor RsiW